LGNKFHPLARRPKMPGSFRAAVKAARRQEALYFAALLSEESILEAFKCGKGVGTLIDCEAELW